MTREARNACAPAYDGDGTRVSRQVGTGPLTRYVSDVNSALPLIVDDGSRTYVYGLGLAYAVSGSTLEVYHADRLGSVRELSDASGTVTATYRTDEWGIPTGTTGGSSQPFAYTGEPVDGTGLTYLRARYYDPSLGRFTSRDTWPGWLGSPATLNRYAYVGNNPTARTDPSGHCFVDTVADVGFIAYDLISLVFGPPKEREANLTALGLDLIGAGIPCATGLGLVARAGIKYGRAELKLTATVAGHATTRPFVNSPLLVDMIMSTARGIPDPQGVANVLRWDVPGFFNGKAGTWELVVDMSSNTAIHFNFVR